MRVKYVDEYGDELADLRADIMPRHQDRVVVKQDTYFVKDIIWDLDEEIVTVELSFSSEKAVKEEAPVVNNLHESKLALQKAEQALKETKSLKAELFTVRQFVKSQQTKK